MQFCRLVSERAQELHKQSALDVVVRAAMLWLAIITERALARHHSPGGVLWLAITVPLVEARVAVT